MASNTINEYLGCYQGKQLEVFASTLLEAKTKALKGAERKAFMKECLSAKPK